MIFTEEEIKELGKEYQENVRKANKKMKNPSSASLKEIEDWMIENKIYNSHILREFLRKQGASTKLKKKVCPKCKAKLNSNGYKSRKIETGVNGSILFKRRYYICTNSECKNTVFPFDEQLNLLTQQKACGRFEEQICHLSAYMPFDQVRQYLENFERVKITETMIRETAERRGSFFKQIEERNAVSTSSSTEERYFDKAKTSECQYIQVDGAMVPIRKTENSKVSVEYKENKAAIIFAKEDMKKDKVKQKFFCTSLGKNVKHFEMLLKGLAIKTKSYKAKQIVFISDGAEWIDRLRERLFPESIHILDFYHAKEHLYNCAKKIFGEKNISKIKIWVEPLEKLLIEGNVKQICKQLKNDIGNYRKHETEIRNLYNYYISRIEKMRYNIFRENEYYIGSGAIESAHKYLMQQRLKQAGMKWSISGATAIIKLREIIYSNLWRETWNSNQIQLAS